MSASHETGHAFAKLMFFVLGALKVFLGEGIVPGELLQLPFFENLVTCSQSSDLKFLPCRQMPESDLNIGHEMEGCLSV